MGDLAIDEAFEIDSSQSSPDFDGASERSDLSIADMESTFGRVLKSLALPLLIALTISYVLRSPQTVLQLIKGPPCITANVTLDEVLRNTASDLGVILNLGELVIPYQHHYLLTRAISGVQYSRANGSGIAFPNQAQLLDALLEYGHELNQTGRQLSNLVDLSSRGLIQVAAELSPTGAVREKAVKIENPDWLALQDRVLIKAEINNAFDRIDDFVGSLTAEILRCQRSLEVLQARRDIAQDATQEAHHFLSTTSTPAAAGLRHLFSPITIPSLAALSSSLQDITQKLFEIREENAGLGRSACWVTKQYDSLEYLDKVEFHHKVKSAAKDLHEKLHDKSIEIALIRLQAHQLMKKSDSTRGMPPPPPWDLTHGLMTEWRERHLFD